jgi:hypothetical protein
MSLTEESVKPFSSVGSGSHQGIVAGEPDLADGIACHDLVIPGTQIAEAPDAGVKAGIHAEGREFRNRDLR